MFMSALWALDHALHSSSKFMVATHGVTGPQRLAVRLIGRAPGMTAGELARQMHLHPSTVTGVLARLEARRCVRRTMDRADRRRQYLSLTPKGRALYRQSAGTIEASIERALTATSEGDVETVIRVLAGVASTLREATSKSAAKGGRAGVRSSSRSGTARAARTPR